MEWFKEQFSQSNIIAGLLSLGIWGTIVYLSIIQVPVPDLLTAGGMAIIAFFFGSKVGRREGEERAARAAKSKRGGYYNG